MIHTLRDDPKRTANKETTLSFLRKWLTLKQAAFYLGLTVRGLEGYVRRGQIKGYKPFGRILFDIHELDLIVTTSPKGGLL